MANNPLVANGLHGSPLLTEPNPVSFGNLTSGNPVVTASSVPQAMQGQPAQGQTQAMDALGAAYLARYPGVAADPYFATHPLEHFQRYGQKEGRVWGPADAAPAQAAQTTPAYQPAEQTAAIYGNSPESWAAYQQQARAQTEGINRMPGVFSNTAAIPTDPAKAKAMMYQTDANGGNPLMKQLTDWIAATAGK